MNNINSQSNRALLGKSLSAAAQAGLDLADDPRFSDQEGVAS